MKLQAEGMNIINSGEEFSFPIITSCSSSTSGGGGGGGVLPPLWRISSINRSISGSTHGQSEAVLVAHDQENELIRKRTKMCRRSFSEIEGQIGKTGSPPPCNDFDEQEKLSGGRADDEEEEKMDMLWEDFNEGLIINKAGIGFSSSDDDDCSFNRNNNKNKFSCSAAPCAGEGFETLKDTDQYYSASLSFARTTTTTDHHELMDRMPKACRGSSVPVGKKKNNLESAVRMLKKLFLLQNISMARINKRSAPAY